MSDSNLQYLLVNVELLGPLADAALALPENKSRRLVHSAGKSSTSDQDVLSHGRIALYLNQQPKDISKGFVFGSDPRSCDVLLDRTKSTGISANHLSIHVDWVSRDPMITCLSSNALQARVPGSKTITTLSKNAWQGLTPGIITNIHVAQGLDLVLSNPPRGHLQAAYDRNLQDYYLKFKNAVPELANISLSDTEVTPLILHRCPGLDGSEYYTTGRIVTGDPQYDAKVLLYDAKRRPMADAPEIDVQKFWSFTHAKDDDDMYDWNLDDERSRRPLESCVVKHFREKRTKDSLPHRFQELCQLNHFNLEDLVDLITEPSVFMTVTSTFSHTTLHVLLHQEKPLSAEEAGFVVEQTFSALEYLHKHGWTHGNLDPRSINVMSRKYLYIQLTDVALSDHVVLGKPNGYHTTYASQRIQQDNKFPGDIWSAGVVALQLLLPNGLPHRNVVLQKEWVLELERLAVIENGIAEKQATAFLTAVLKSSIEERPTATEVLEDPWIEQSRVDVFVNNPHYMSGTPQRSRHPSVGPSRRSSRQGSSAPLQSIEQWEHAPGSHRTSVGPSRRSSKQGSSTPMQSIERYEHAPGSRRTSAGPSRRHDSVASSNSATNRSLHENYKPASRAPFPGFSRESSTDMTPQQAMESQPYLGDEYIDFDLLREKSNSRSSSVTHNPLTRKSHTPTPYAPEGNLRTPYSTRYLRSQSHSSETGSAGSSRSQPGSSRGKSPASDKAMATLGRTYKPSEAEIEEDSGEETETSTRRQPVSKKPRKGGNVPPSDRILRSHGHGRR